MLLTFLNRMTAGGNLFNESEIPETRLRSLILRLRGEAFSANASESVAVNQRRDFEDSGLHPVRVVVA